MERTVAPVGTGSENTSAPVGTVNVFDPHPLNWLFITWNTMEEPIRTDPDGYIVMALAESAEWRDPLTLEVRVREGARFQDGEPATLTRSSATSTRCRGGRRRIPPAPI